MPKNAENDVDHINTPPPSSRTSSIDILRRHPPSIHDEKSRKNLSECPRISKCCSKMAENHLQLATILRIPQKSKQWDSHLVDRYVADAIWQPQNPSSPLSSSFLSSSSSYSSSSSSSSCSVIDHPSNDKSTKRIAHHSADDVSKKLRNYDIYRSSVSPFISLIKRRLARVNYLSITARWRNSYVV